MPGKNETGEKHYRIPRGAAATAAKNKHRDKNYDRAELTLPKGMKEVVKQIAKTQGKSFNGYIWEAVKEKTQRDTGEELLWEKHTEQEGKAE